MGLSTKEILSIIVPLDSASSIMITEISTKVEYPWAYSKEKANTIILEITYSMRALGREISNKARHHIP